MRSPGLMDERHVSCFSFAAAADDLRSACLWIMSNHRDKEDNLQSRQHKEVLETSKHQRVHKSLRWDDRKGAAAGWWSTCVSSEQLITTCVSSEQLVTTRVSSEQLILHRVKLNPSLRQPWMRVVNIQRGNLVHEYRSYIHMHTSWGLSTVHRLKLGNDAGYCIPHPTWQTGRQTDSQTD